MCKLRPANDAAKEISPVGHSWFISIVEPIIWNFATTAYLPLSSKKYIIH
jgi:hypothetical protein